MNGKGSPTRPSKNRPPTWWKHPDERLLERYGLELGPETWLAVREHLPSLAHEVLDQRTAERECRLSYVPIAQPPQGTLWVPVVWETGHRAGRQAPEVLIRTVLPGGYWTGAKFEHEETSP